MADSGGGTGATRPARMRAVRVHRFGGVEELVCEDVPVPRRDPGQVLVRVHAAGVGPWDAWVREGKSAIAQPLPLVPGSDFSGVVEEADGEPFRPGRDVFGVTNARFTGAYAEYAVAETGMVAAKPAGLSHVEAASVPVVASTAWQMVFDHGGLERGMRVLVLGGAGNVGAYAVQIAASAGAEVIATAMPPDLDVVRSLGAADAVAGNGGGLEALAGTADLVVDTVGGEPQVRSFGALRRGGTLVSSVSPPDQGLAERHGVKGVFFLVSVTSAGLEVIARELAEGRLAPSVGEVLALADVRVAHEMLAGRPHKRGKIVLTVGA